VTMTKNIALDNVIKSLLIRCPSAVSGNKRCSWEGALSGLGEHLAVCEMEMVDCPNKNCGAPNHCIECPHRTVVCGGGA